MPKIRKNIAASRKNGKLGWVIIKRARVITPLLQAYLDLPVRDVWRFCPKCRECLTETIWILNHGCMECGYKF